MSDPKHPPKVVIVVRGGKVDFIFSDKSINARVFVADYDIPPDMTEPELDARGQSRYLTEETILADTAAVRNIINKKGGKKDGDESR